MKDDKAQIFVAARVPASTVKRLDALATRHGCSRARFVRKLIYNALDGGENIETAPDAPTHDELLDLLAEKARAGNVAAIRSLLAREDEKQDPRQRALRSLEAIAAERQS